MRNKSGGQRVLIVGGGAAGMLCAIFAARSGAEVSLFEKNEKLGKKLFITGKGRCNLTNRTDIRDFFDYIMRNKSFLYSSLYGFSNEDVCDFFEELGLRIKTERGNRVFPESDHSYDVIDVLKRELKRQQVSVYINTEVKSLLFDGDVCNGLETADGRKFAGEALIIATGGLSYPSTGSTGDGYRFAKEAGHHVTSLTPSLVPMRVREEFVSDLMGLSLKNTGLRITDGKEEVYRDFGEMLFTHFGVSGPMILSASANIDAKRFSHDLRLHLDLKPALDNHKLDQRILRDLDEAGAKQVKNGLKGLLPATLFPIILELAGIDGDKRCAEMSREERESLIRSIKDFSLTIKSLCGFEEAVITRGGVDVREVDPGTMESKKKKNLYFIGEVLDVDALTGGFNLQIAWSTAAQAGRAVGQNGGMS
ncbi:MAG: NAD(P)/FAD-dependent oxidoreductase [Lachnospiraceae bacterium]|nr:NAD(P)/FAD-dependent oxidoreductase [Lachnospiraceae bacterium]